YITKAADYFDLKKRYGSLNRAFAATKCRFLVISFASDWLFTPAQSKAMVDALAASGKDVSYCNIDSPYGHDAFLLEPTTLGDFLSGFLMVTHHPAEGRNNRCTKRRRQTDVIRVDYEAMESLIEPNSTVLDIGCGDGQLMSNLMADRNIRAQGIESDQDFVLDCVRRRVPVIQHDIEEGLKNYADKSYDYVLLSQTVQTIKNSEDVFTELLRVGRKVIVSFPNFANWRCRAQLFFRGKAPVTKQLPFGWYDTPNIHCLSLKDFDSFCKSLGVTIEKKIPLVKTRLNPVRIMPNLFAEQVIYITSKE
ncbi:MAG: methionine biosynthesis protein MetW, partial [Planctomycetes bacterium]|nr:methionine biosynthesis protein MetW [Planctomycetota bacterium]